MASSGKDAAKQVSHPQQRTVWSQIPVVPKWRDLMKGLFLPKTDVLAAEMG